jgi:hypothetical protein
MENEEVQVEGVEEVMPVEETPAEEATEEETPTAE